MIESLNKVQLIGNIVAGPELKESQSGNKIVNLILQTAHEWRGYNNDTQVRNDTHKVVVFGSFALICNEALEVGDQIYVEGVLQNNAWEDDNGVIRYRTEVISKNLFFLKTKKKLHANNF